jgi:hypothetical protein
VAFDPFRAIFGKAAGAQGGRAEAARAPLSGNRRESVQRLQVGFFGLTAMVLLVGLANVIMNSVQQSQATAVPEAAPTSVASEPPPQASDPLADAGVVPDLPAEDGAPAARADGPAPVGTTAPPAANGSASPQP